MRDSWICLFFGLLGLFATTVPAMAGAPYLVSDIDPVPITAGSQIGIHASLDNSLTLFSPADDESGAGRELWVSDGSESGTLRLTDACPGPCSSNPGLVAANGLWALLALGNAQTGQTDLWISRGTAASTVKVATGVTPTYSFRNRFAWSADRRVVFFLASRPATGMELWKSDGTPAGTALVRDIEPGPAATKLGEMLFHNGRLYFGAIDSRRGAALWTSDGTSAGTAPLKVTARPPAETFDRPFFLTQVGRLLYFVARPSGRSWETWRTDGTAGGTFPVSNLSTPILDTRIQGIIAAGGKAYFLGKYQSRRGQELFVSDGTPRGTRQLTAFEPETPFYNQFYTQEFLGERSVALGARLVFWVNDGIHGEEPWVADPAMPQARLLADICPGACSSNPFVVGVVAGRLFLNAGDTATGRELWVTDGTAAGTRLVRDICPGSCSSEPWGIAIFGNRFFFAAVDGQIGGELYMTDGTPAGTRLVRDFCPGPCGSNAEWLLGQVPGGFLAGIRETDESVSYENHDALFRIDSQGNASRLGDLHQETYDFPVAAVRPQVLYTHDDGEHGEELWRTDGTPEGTRLVRDLNRRDVGGSRPTGFLSLGGQALFFVPARDEGLDLWKSDGTNGGTVLVKRLLPPPASRYFNPSWLPTLELGGRLFLSLGGTLWVTDGTAAGTVRAIPDSVVNPYPQAVLGGEVYFWAAENQTAGLWKTDGTPAGTVRLAVQTRSLHSGPELATSGDRLFFFKDWEIWQTDGTAAGTSRLLPYEGPIYRDPSKIAFYRGALYFLAQSKEAGSSALFRTDGTEAGTVQVMLLSDFGSQLLVVGDRLAVLGLNSLLLGDGTAAGMVTVSPSVGMHPIAWRDGVLFSVEGDLWRSDGTAAGTGPLVSREGNRVPIHDGKFQALGSRLFFLTRDKALWQTDGTPGGTEAVAVPEGGLSLETHGWGAAAGLVFFRGYDPATGYELWALPPD